MSRQDRFGMQQFLLHRLGEIHMLHLIFFYDFYEHLQKYQKQYELIFYLINEAGKTIQNAIDEIREGVGRAVKAVGKAAG